MTHTAVVADDDALTRLVLRAALEGRGYRVREARDGSELLGSLTPDVEVLLMDAGMPGPGLSERLTAAHAAAPRCRVIVMSGTPVAADQLAPVGASFLCKPIGVATLDRELALVRTAVSEPV